MPFDISRAEYEDLIVRMNACVRHRMTVDPAELEEMHEYGAYTDVQESGMWGDFHRILNDITHNQANDEVSEAIVAILEKLRIAAAALFAIKDVLGDRLTPALVSHAMEDALDYGLYKCIYRVIQVPLNQP